MRAVRLSLFVLLAPTALAHGQSPRATARVGAVRASAGSVACASIAAGPTDLVRTPEGRALLNFKHQLDEAATVFVQRGSNDDARRMAEVQRGVDSLMQAFVRARSGDGAVGAMITTRRTDSTARVIGWPLPNGSFVFSMESAIKAMRPAVEVTLRSLEPQVAGLMTTREGTAMRAPATGYLGINLSGSRIRLVTDSGSFTAHCDYPMIEAVDDDSPARAADLRAGDTVVAYNGRDLVAVTVNYPQLLVPGKVIRVRVRRDGRSKEMPVTVAARPTDMAEASVRFFNIPSGPISPLHVRMADIVVRSMPVTSLAGVGIPSSVSVVILEGAQLNEVDDELAQSLGIEPGVRVGRVQAGSPAAEAGLRTGEIIRAVNGMPVRELSTIQRAIGAPGARDVKLTVSARDSLLRVVTIRW